VFTPEIAVLVFVFLLLFFIALSFGPKNLAEIFLTVYFWRAGMEVANKLYNLLVQTYFIDSVWGLPEVEVGPTMFGLPTLTFIKLAAAAFLLLIFYFFSGRLLRPARLNFHWLWSFFVLLSLAGFFFSSFLYIFSFEWEFYQQPIWEQGFLTPLSQVVWLLLPIVFAVLANFFSRRSLRGIWRRISVGRG